MREIKWRLYFWNNLMLRFNHFVVSHFILKSCIPTFKKILTDNEYGTATVEYGIHNI
jgi:hypothetical protein